MKQISVKNSIETIDQIHNANNISLMNYLNKLRLMISNMFEWKNLPNNMSKRFIENSLYYEGKLAFFKDEILGLIVTKCNDNADYNIYDEATSYNCYATNYSKNISADDLVIIRNNNLEIPTSFFIEMYAERLSNIDRTIDVNIFQQKTPTLILCKESQRITLKNLFMKVQENEPLIYGNKDLDLSSISSLDLNAPFVADKLMDIKNKIWTECLSDFGINNANTDKKERLITDEVNANNELLFFNREIFLNSRIESVNLINEKFGTDIKVSLKNIKEGDIFE